MNSKSKIFSFFLIVFLITQFSSITLVSTETNADNENLMINAGDLISFGGERDTLYGEIVTGIGDYNMDGFGDFVVGGRKFSNWRGKAWIYYGDQNGPTGRKADFTIIGEPNRENSGVCMGHTAINLGDINGDDVSDFAVSGPGSYGGWDVGKVYIFHGDPRSAPATAMEADMELVSPIKYDWFGESLATAGDFNGDNFQDLIVGAPGTNWEGSGNRAFENGRAYIFFGTPEGYASIPDITLRDDINFSAFGLHVSGNGDINNDGYDDAIIGASWSNRYKGRAHIYLGSAQPDPTPQADLILSSEVNRSYFGEYVAIINDINGDGYDEFAIRTTDTTVESYTEKVLIYFGRNSISDISDPSIVLTGEEPGNDFGKFFTSLDDMNKDSYMDFAIGAPALGSDDPGKVFVYYGDPNFNGTPSKIYVGEESHDQFGFSVPSEDIDGDNKLDLIMTSLFHGQTGRTYIDLSGEITESFNTLLVFAVVSTGLFIVTLVISQTVRRKFY